MWLRIECFPKISLNPSIFNDNDRPKYYSKYRQTIKTEAGPQGHNQ